MAAAGATEKMSADDRDGSGGNSNDGGRGDGNDGSKW
jgi:hypothetical protein